MSDYLGLGHGVYGGTFIRGYEGTRIHLFTDTKHVVSNSILKDFDSKCVVVKGVLHVGPTHDSFVTQPVTFSWGAVANVYEYQLQIAEDINFSVIARTVETIHTSIDIDNLEDGTYYWRVRYR